MVGITSMMERHLPFLRIYPFITSQKKVIGCYEEKGNMMQNPKQQMSDALTYPLFHYLSIVN